MVFCCAMSAKSCRLCWYFCTLQWTVVTVAAHDPEEHYAAGSPVQHMKQLMHLDYCMWLLGRNLCSICAWVSDSASVKQIPFDEVVAGGRGSSSSQQPHTLVPANLLLTTVQSLAASTSQPPPSRQHHVTGSHSPHFSSGKALYCIPAAAPVHEGCRLCCVD